MNTLKNNLNTTSTSSNASNIPALDGPEKHYPVIIVGGGQAGMAMSFCLGKLDIEHLILDKAQELAHNWQHERWDSFCLVTPNWQCQLPGFPYNGDDPDGFMVKDEIINYLKAYRDFFNPPIQFSSPVSSLSQENGLFHIKTPKQYFTADQVVLACGGYHKPNILPFAQQFPDSMTQVHSRDYKNSKQLPEGEVMVIGTGQSGSQIAEDLHLEGRKVHLCVGSAPRVNRRYRGKDVVNWLNEMDYYQMTIDKHPEGDNAPHATNHYVTGRDGGRDLNLRVFAEQGMQLYGKMKTVVNGVIEFEDDLKTNLDYADNAAKRIRASIEKYIDENNIDAPADQNIHSQHLPESPSSLDLNTSNITSVVWATGFKMQFDWLKVPVTDNSGRPIQKRGLTDTNGLYFLGLNWMHTWGSGRFFHVGQDAEFISEQIAQKLKKQAIA